MSLHSRAKLLLVHVMLIALACAGCGSPVSTTAGSPTKGASGTPTLQSIALAPAKPSITAGGTVQFTATGTYSDGSTAIVTASASWSSSASATATVSAGGLATGVAAGSATISAAVGTVSGSASLTVTAVATATVTSVAVTPAGASIAVNGTVQYAATATLSDGTTSDVTREATWTSSKTSVATVNSSGLVTGVAAGTSTIGAKLATGVSGAAVVTVTGATVTLASIAVKPVNATLTRGSTLQYTATATYSDGTTSNVSSSAAWSSSSTGVATVSATGLATAMAAGSSTIAVKIGSVSGSTGLTVQATASTASTDVLTYKNDLSRSGLNSAETILTPANVKSATFGLLHKLAVDGLVFSQPLYAAQVTVAGAAHNVVYFVTEHNSAYAYDADTGALLWRVTLQLAGETTSDDRACDQVSPEIGATATPVIDRSMGTSGAMYVVAMSKDTSSAYHQRLHALDLATGAELFGGPREIQATYPTANGTTTLDPSQYKERSGLLLLNGEVYTTWTSHCDDDPYTGWILAYNESNLAQTRVFNIAPNSGGFGPSIWMSGGAPAVDAAGNIYIMAANGVFETVLDANGFPSLQDYGNSYLKISTANQTLAVTDYFTMWNEISESNADLDLGGGGPLLLPDVTDSTGTVKHLAIGAGKDGIVYVVDRDNMGKFNASKNNIWQELDGLLAAAARSTPAYFNGHVYLSDRDHSLKSLTIASAKLPTVATSQSTATFVYPGTSPSVSSNGTSNGIVWAIAASNPGVLYAYDANNLATQLYSSSQAAASRDSFGAAIKYAPPTIADGKVFVPAQTTVAVFGLLH
jgi:uncharacterized protein YjdB